MCLYRVEKGGNKLLTSLSCHCSSFATDILYFVSVISLGISLIICGILSMSEPDPSWWHWLAQTYRDANHLAPAQQLRKVRNMDALSYFLENNNYLSLFLP